MFIFTLLVTRVDQIVRNKTDKMALNDFYNLWRLLVCIIIHFCSVFKELVDLECFIQFTFFDKTGYFKHAQDRSILKWFGHRFIHDESLKYRKNAFLNDLNSQEWGCQNYKQLHKFFIKVKKYEQLDKFELGQKVWTTW